MRSAIALVAVLWPAQASADELDGLMKELAAMPGLEAKFTETKHITLLAAPLETEGVLRFAPPASLLRETTKPQKSRVLIEKDRLYFDDGKRGQEVNVGNNPVVRSFVNSFVLLLAGDRKALEETFRMTYAPGETWTLELVPKKPPISKIITKMTVRGRGVELESLRVDEATGDYTETKFVDVNTKKRYDGAEKAQLFRVPR